MSALRRGWMLTRLTLRVVREDRELIAFPVVIWLLIVPAIFATTLHVDRHPRVVLMLMLIAWATACFAGTFTAFCVTYTTRHRLDGGDATLWDSVRFTLGQLHFVCAWGCFQCLVGSILGLVEEAAERLGAVGRVVLRPIHRLLSLAWRVAIMFAIQAMVYDRIAPIPAVTKSIRVVRDRWGTALVRTLGFTVFKRICFCVGGIPLLLLHRELPPESTIAGVTAALLFSYLLAVYLAFRLLETIFDTALYHFATTGRTARGFDPELLRSAVGGSR